jgi:hypothetical protein
MAREQFASALQGARLPAPAAADRVRPCGSELVLHRIARRRRQVDEAGATSRVRSPPAQRTPSRFDKATKACVPMSTPPALKKP